MALQILIAGLDRTAYYEPGTLRIRDLLNERSAAEFSLIATDSYRPQPLDPVELRISGRLVFGGIVWEVEEELLAPGATARRMVLRCKDQHYLADRRLVAETYENMVAGDIVADLVAKYLRADGVVGLRTQPSFSRNSVAYLSNGQQVAAGVPRFEPGRFGQAVMVEEGTTNLLSNPGFESGSLSGWGSRDEGVYHATSATSSDKWEGAFSCRVEVRDLGGITLFHNYAIYQQVTSGVSNNPFTISAFLKAPAGRSIGLRVVRRVDGVWRWEQGSSADAWTIVTSTGSWQRVSATVAAWTQAGTTDALEVRVGFYKDANLAVGDVCFIDAVILEQKAYPTTYIPSTRSPESLIIPGSVLGSEFAVELFVKLPQTGRIWGLIHSGGPGDLDGYIDANGYPYFYTTNTDSSRTAIISAVPVVPNNWNYIAIEVGPGFRKIYVNGQLGAQDNKTPQAIGDLWLGTNPEFTYFLNSLFDSLRISRRARTDAEIAAAYQSGQPLAWDADTTYLLQFDGILAAQVPIQAGPTIAKAVFNYQPLSECLNELAEMAGYYWRISHSKVLHFADRTTLRAPWPLDTSAKVRGVRIRRHGEQYRNRQYLRAGTDTTEPRTERFKGDGETRTFTLAFPVAKVPTVRVNGVTQTVGIRGLDTGKQWYWSKGDPTITQDLSAVPLTASDTLEITYEGMFPIIVASDAGAEVAARGPYEAVEEEANLDDADAALEVADAKLRRYAKLATELQYETREPGLVPGMLQPVNLPTLGVAGEYLISEVSLEDFGADALDRYRYVVRALDGEPLGGWEAFFRQLATRGRTFVIRENEVLVKLRRVGADVLVLADTFGKVAAAPENRVGYAQVGYSEVA